MNLLDYLDPVPEPLWPVRFRAERAYEDMVSGDADKLRSACVDFHGCSGRFLRAAREAESEREAFILGQAAGACAAIAHQAQQRSEQREAAARAMEACQ